MTRFLIAKQVGPDAYRTIAGACDGYLEHTGAMLLEHYSSTEKVDRLLDLGDIRCLYKNLDWPEGTSYEPGKVNKDVTVSFGRDCGEEGTEAAILSLEQLDSLESWNEYIYIFTDAHEWAYFEAGMSEYGLLDLRDSVNRLMEAPPPKVVAAPKHRYYDANQRKIFADTHIQFPSGTVEKVYATQDADGNPDLGINASNDAYMRNHGIPEAEREFYSLSAIDLHGVEICEPTEDMAPTLTM